MPDDTNNASTPAQEAARSALDALHGDSAWTSRFLAGDANAKAESDRLSRLAYAPEAAAQAGDALSSVEANTGTKSAAEARARIDYLRNDRAFSERIVNGDHNAIEEWRRLQQLAATDPSPTAEQTPAASPAEKPPESPLDYRLHTMVDLTPEGQAELSELQKVAHAAELPASWFQQISEQAQRDGREYAGMSYDQVVDHVDDQLHRIFGADYDQAAAGAKIVVDELEKKIPGLRLTLQKSGLTHNLSLLTFLMQQGRARMRK